MGGKELVTIYRGAIALFVALIAYLAVQTYENVDSLKTWAVKVNERGENNRRDIDEIKQNVNHVTKEVTEIHRAIDRLDFKTP